MYVVEIIGNKVYIHLTAIIRNNTGDYMITETKKYICDECRNDFEANANIVNPICTLCQTVHIENSGFEPDMTRIFAKQKQEAIEAIPTNEELEDFFSNFDPFYDYQGGD